MIHYLVIGHACDEEQEWRHMMFDDEQPDKYLEAKFIQRLREDDGSVSYTHLTLPTTPYV